jgi:transposase
MDILKEAKLQHYKTIFTGDESYICLSSPHLFKWMPAGSERPEAPKNYIGTEKRLLTVFFSGHKVWHACYLAARDTVKSDTFVQDVLNPLTAEVKAARPALPSPWLLHMDNARVHRSKDTEKAIDNSPFVVVPHPPYSPDLAPSDFYLFGYLKDRLRGEACTCDEQLHRATERILNDIEPSVLARVFEEWYHRCEWVIANGGADFHR